MVELDAGTEMDDVDGLRMGAVHPFSGSSGQSYYNGGASAAAPGIVPAATILGTAGTGGRALLSLTPPPVRF